MLTVVLWLDANSASNNSFRDKLSQYRWVEIFNKPDDCIDYIKTHLTQTLFLVVSGSLAEPIVPQISQCANIKQIFVFCASIESHIHWAMNYIDRLLMFDHHDDLLERLWNEMEEHFREQAQECIRQADELKEQATKYKQPSCG